ncbi:centromere protein C isoform X2 [Populus alba]|uniref:Centromere protein C-like isoform X2 n=1 Tax=Populus alba x Populus x berolinensis TaxID=444605 RepID=A0AAD6WA26_9ROSI|nr:centromere protein C-like isoform X2 [Populus alba]KAJ7003144.1 centromere protein C-like isoform X2 [Populus alba x Populus x berolinensis]
MTELEDPLQGYSGLSLFRRTLGSLLKPPHDLDDLLSAHNLLKSLPVKNPDKLIEQARSILDATPEPTNADLPNGVMPEDKSEVVAQKDAESPRARRPGLGRKRARFSLFPNASQPTVNLEPTLDIDSLKDPEQFFLAFERLEDAKKEMAKQTGRVSIGSNQSRASMAPRHRRPGMPGRSRTAKYQHLYPTMSSQETFMENILSPANPGSQQETFSPDVASQLRESTNLAPEESGLEVAGSMAKAEKRVDKLLDELLSRDYEELDGDGAVTLLRDCLQVKALDLEKLSLPELLNVQKTSLNALGGNLPKTRNVLSDIHNLPRRTITPMRQQIAGNSSCSFGSPTPPKSPLASLALLRKRILQSNPPTDPFSVFDVDQSPETNASSLKNINNSSDPVDIENDLSLLKSLIIEEDDTTASNTSPAHVAIGDSGTQTDKSLNDNLTSAGSVSDGCPSRSSTEVKNRDVGADNVIIDENSSQLGGDMDIQTKGPNAVEDMVEDMQHKTVDKSLNDNLISLGPSSDVCCRKSSAEVEIGNPGVDNGVIDDNLSQLGGDADIQTNRPNELEDMVEDIQQKAVDSTQPDDTPMEFLNNAQDQFEQLSPAVVEDHAMDDCPETPDSGLEQTKDNCPEHQDETVEEPPVVSLNKQAKAKSKGRKNGLLSKRHSLAASGTSWETGLRRSTRIRSRPLEYWKGERFLYGRIHGSLATVIGIKYESPGNDKGKRALKVKSYVSDEYKDLVELAALH